MLSRFSTVVLAILSATATGLAQEGRCPSPAETSFPDTGTNPNLNPMCGRKMKLTAADTKSVSVTVEDTSGCPMCAVGGIDLSPVAFQQLADLAVGRLHNVSWTLL
ncbi:hypothetical protein V8D89_006740 [Ganoderma adspersum]